MALAVKLYKNSGYTKIRLMYIQKMPMLFEALIYSPSAVLNS
jgi:hypothetical protein